MTKGKTSGRKKIQKRIEEYFLSSKLEKKKNMGIGGGYNCIFKSADLPQNKIGGRRFPPCP
jgi:hypothetical protein